MGWYVSMGVLISVEGFGCAYGSVDGCGSVNGVGGGYGSVDGCGQFKCLV